MKAFSALTPREILAISSEEEDARIYMTFADDLRERYPASAKVFDQMAGDETEHRHRLLELYEKRFSPKLPPIRRKDVKGFLKRRPISLTSNLSLDAIRKEAEAMEYQAARFYQGAAEQTTDVEVRRLLGAEAEEVRESHAQELEKSILTQKCSRGRGSHPSAHVVLQYAQQASRVSWMVQCRLWRLCSRGHSRRIRIGKPSLLGLRLPLAPVISMGFAEALSDDGSLTGRGSPWLRRQHLWPDDGAVTLYRIHCPTPFGSQLASPG